METNNEEELLGDKVEKLLKTVGADKIAETYETVTKRPCGCKKRKEFLNKLHKQMQDMRDSVLKAQKDNASK